MLPLLKLAGENGQICSIAELRNKLAHQLKITPEQQAIKLPSGKQSIFSNRVGWASTYLSKAKLLEKPKRGYVRITQRGQGVLRDNPSPLDAAYLKQFEEFREFKNHLVSEEQRIAQEEDKSLLLTTTPEETLDEAIAIYG